MKKLSKLSLLFIITIIFYISNIEASNLKKCLVSEGFEKTVLNDSIKTPIKSFIKTPEKVQTILNDIVKKDKQPGEWGVISKITFFIKNDINFVIYLNWGNISSIGTVRGEIKEDIKKQIERSFVDFDKDGKIYCYIFKDKLNSTKNLSERKFYELPNEIQEYLKENNLDELWYEDDD